MEELHVAPEALLGKLPSEEWTHTPTPTPTTHFWSSSAGAASG